MQRVSSDVVDVAESSVHKLLEAFDFTLEVQGFANILKDSYFLFVPVVLVEPAPEVRQQLVHD